MTKLLAIALSLTALLGALPVNSAVRPEAAPVASMDLMASVTARSHPDAVPAGEAPAAAADFAVRLLQAGMSGEENTLLSPLSVLCALSMTANGADGDTRSQMEAVLGMPVEELNTALRSWSAALPAEETCRLELANAIWFTDDPRFTVSQDFLQTNADWYGAGAYRSPFDQGTCGEINAWVQEHTGGMIDGILDSIPADAVMYLVNALAFDGQWAKTYEAHQLREGQFTAADGRVLPAELMWSVEKRFLQDEKAVGFVKPYEGGRYGFAALLPEEGVSLTDYAASLTGKKLTEMLEGAREVKVNAALPKFTSDYKAELSEVLAGMGMPLAFDRDLADFSLLGSWENGNLSIDKVIHKTHISVDERGTEAAASTAVGMVRTTAAIVEETREVILDRPFLYLIVDLENNVPVFIGTVNEL